MFNKYTGIFAISTNGVIGYEIYEKYGKQLNILKIWGRLWKNIEIWNIVENIENIQCFKNGNIESIENIKKDWKYKAYLRYIT